MGSFTKYCIYGDESWRRLDINTGHIEGWGQARFAYSKRGKLELASSRKVLAALQDFKGGNNCVVKDGPLLPYIKSDTQQRIEKHPVTHSCACLHSHCCRHSNKNTECISIKTIPPVTSIQTVEKADASIQTRLLSQNVTSKTKSSKRRRNSTTSEEEMPSRVVTTATVHSISVNKEKNEPKKLSIMSSDKYKKKVTNEKLKRKKSNSTDSVKVCMPISNETNSASKRGVKTSKAKERRKSTSSETNSEAQPKTKIKKQIQGKGKSKNDQKSSMSSSDEEIELPLSKLQTGTETVVRRLATGKKVTEVFIGDSDVDVLRNYLMRTSQDFDLLKFDEDDDYKRQFFYGITPLVNVQRHPEIARILRRRDEMSQKDFVSNLGLRSVSGYPVPQRYKMRKNNRQNTSKIDPNSDSETDSSVENRIVNSSKKSTIHNRYSAESDSESDFETVMTKKIDKKKHGRANAKPDSSKKSVRKDGSDNVKILRKKAMNEPNQDTSKKKSSEEVHSRTLHKKSRISCRKSSVTSDPENCKSNDRIQKNKKLNTSKTHNIDLTVSDSEDTDIQNDRRGKKNEHISLKSGDELIRYGKNKNDNVKNSTNDKTSNNRKVPRVRNERGQYLSMSPTKNQEFSDPSYENSEIDTDDDNPIPRQLKTRQSIINIGRKNSTNGTKDENVGNQSDKSGLDSKSPKLLRRQKSASDRKDANQTKNMTNSINDKESNYPIVLKRNRRGRFLKMSSTKNKKQQKNKASSYEDTESGTDDSNPTLRQLKTRLSTINISGKHDASESKNKNDGNQSDNPRIDGKSPKTRRQRTIYRKNLDIEESSEDEFETRPRTRKNKNEKSRNGIENSENKSQKIRPNRVPDQESDDEELPNKRNDTHNKINDRNNNMTDTNDENSDEDINTRPYRRIRIKPITDTVESEKNNTKKASKYDKKTANDTTETVNLSNSEDEKIKKTNEIKSPAAKRSISGSSMLRVEYSSLEDHAIVTWVSSGGRARCVNGNRIWRDLEQQYQNITGQFRSWHSLRNRYLRSILPRLGAMALDHVVVSRLRAAAATGEIKSRAKPSRRNSIFGMPALGALSRPPGRPSSSTEDEVPPPKRHKHDGNRKLSSPPSRVLRSSLPTSPEKGPARSPRYSQITRRFAATHRDQSASSTSTASRRNSTNNENSRNNSLDTKNSARNSLQTKNTSATKLSDESNKSRKLRGRPVSNRSDLLMKKSPANVQRRSLRINSKSPVLETSATKTKSPRDKPSVANSVNSRRKSLRDKSQESKSATSAAKSREKSPELTTSIMTRRKSLREKFDESKSEANTLKTRRRSLREKIDSISPIATTSRRKSSDNRSPVLRSSSLATKSQSPAKKEASKSVELTKTRKLYNPTVVI